MLCWNSKQNAVECHAPRDAKTSRVLLLARGRAPLRRRGHGPWAERDSWRPAAALSAWPPHRPGHMDLLLQARMGIQPASILPLANAGERSPARPAILMSSHSIRLH